MRSTVTACHCRSCRRFTGGLWTGTVARQEHVVIEESGSLKWYQSSAHAKRAFCSNCGSSLFWQGLEEPLFSIAAGSLDEPTGLKLACHGWTSEAADYWDFSPDVPLRSGPSGLGPPEAG
ncbi:MAG: GFA family protein [Gammaproteobacteria bacterium]|nr:GFA family protein [Gammaproteobacteria bacterium]